MTVVSYITKNVISLSMIYSHFMRSIIILYFIITQLYNQSIKQKLRKA